jgi:hypothetical protein
MISVMPGHRRSKNGVASLAYVPGIPIEMAPRCIANRDGRDKPGYDDTNHARRLIVSARKLNDDFGVRFWLAKST